MMPDKIYLGHDVYNNVDEYWKENSDADVPGKSYVEYIRKDALLEWLESRIKVLSNGGFVNGLTTLAYKDVVEHINEM